MSTWGIIGGIATIIIGFFLAWKAYAIYRQIGKIGWAERYFEGFGGTWGMIRILGILLIVIAFVYLAGGCDYIANRWLKDLFSGVGY